jgi:hypothetical protein
VCFAKKKIISGELLDNFLPLAVDLQNADKTPMKITVASGSLQPFTTDQWAMHQQDTIRKVTLAFGFRRDDTISPIRVLCQCHSRRVLGSSFELNSSCALFWSAEQRRKRMATVHVADPQGARVVGASVTVHQTTKDFPMGSAIASTILGNEAYQVIGDR